jgi:hypothetical protein
MILPSIATYLAVGWLQAKVGDKAAESFGQPVGTTFDFYVNVLLWLPLLLWGAFT